MLLLVQSVSRRVVFGFPPVRGIDAAVVGRQLVLDVCDGEVVKVTLERVRAELADLGGRRLSVADLGPAVSIAVRRMVPHEGYVLIWFDPISGLRCLGIGENALQDRENLLGDAIPLLGGRGPAWRWLHERWVQRVNATEAAAGIAVTTAKVARARLRC